MTIHIRPDRIDFTNYSLRLAEDGIRVASPTSSAVAGLFSFSELNFFSPLYGTVSGYTSGGSPGPSNVIDKFPFATNSNATDVGDLPGARAASSGQSSDTHGYVSAGNASTTQILRFPFATNANAVPVGTISPPSPYTRQQDAAGQSSPVSGYISGGYSPSSGFPPSPIGSRFNQIQRFPFASTSFVAVQTGILSLGRNHVTGQSSEIAAYTSGGVPPVGPEPRRSTTIDKFPFAAEGNATDVGDLTQLRSQAAGQSSVTHGYTSGGFNDPPPVTTNTIDKFSFASDANATDVGDLTQARMQAAGQSSTVSGYSSGAQDPGVPPAFNTIDKFPFSTDTNASDVGDLSQARGHASGQQD